MTSKEALNDLLSGEIISLNSYMDLRLGIIKQDLEVLDILKKYVYFSSKSGCVRMKDVYKRTTNFDYEDLREWLENDSERENSVD